MKLTGRFAQRGSAMLPSRPTLLDKPSFLKCCQAYPCCCTSNLPLILFSLSRFPVSIQALACCRSSGK